MRREIRLAIQLLSPFRWHFAAVGIAVLLGVGIGLVRVSTAVPKVGITDRWPLPQWVAYKAAPRQDSVRLLAWLDDPSKPKEVEAAKPAGPPWRFIGTVRNGKTSIAVIEVDQGKRVQRMSTGENLPDGGEIIKVGVGELTYAQDGQEKTLKLFNVEKPITNNQKK